MLIMNGMHLINLLSWTHLLFQALGIKQDRDFTSENRKRYRTLDSFKYLKGIMK